MIFRNFCACCWWAWGRGTRVSEIDFLRIALGVIGGLILFLASVFGWWASRISAKLDTLMTHRLECLTNFADAKKKSAAHQRLWDAFEHLRSGRRCKIEREKE